MKCEGFDWGQLVLPQFQVRLGEIFAIVHPLKEVPSRDELARALAGQISVTGITHSCLSKLVAPSVVANSQGDLTVLEFLQREGIAKGDVSKTLSELSILPETQYCNLQLTHRFLLGLKTTVQDAVQLVVLSLGGLDPLGMRRMLTELSFSKAHCSSLVLFHSNLFAQCEAALGCFFDDVIHLNPKVDR
jgi:hypothetical protein